MGTSTFLMDNVTSQRITLLSLFFIFELLYILFLDIKISNNGDYLVYLSKSSINPQTKQFISLCMFIL